MPTPIPELQMMKPASGGNFFDKMLMMQKLRSGEETAANTSMNAFASKMAEIEQKRQGDLRKANIDSNEFALNLLSGVNSEEDLAIAKRQFTARYPDRSMLVDQILPAYDPRSVDLLRNSLRTETQRLKQEEMVFEATTKMQGFAPGTSVYQGSRKVEQVPKDVKEDYDVFVGPDNNQVYVKRGDKVPAGYRKLGQDFKEDFEVFEGPAGEQVYVEKGKPIPKGFKKVQTKGTSVTVNTGDLSKTTKSKLEDEVIQGVQSIQSFKDTRTKFKPEYITLWGKGDRMVAGAADKLGVSTKDQQTLITDRSNWYRQAKADFIAYRKWATGVAGGEKEMEEIAKAFPDPDKNSPTEYAANLDNIEETTKRVLALNAEFLKSGIDLSQPLDSIMQQMKGAGITAPPGTGGGKGGNGPTVIIEYDEKGNRVTK